MLMSLTETAKTSTPAAETVRLFLAPPSGFFPVPHIFDADTEKLKKGGYC